MSATNKTTNYELPLYVANDKPTYLGDWNSTMNKLDVAIDEAKDSGGVATELINSMGITTDAEALAFAQVVDAAQTATDVQNIINQNVNGYQTQTQVQELIDISQAELVADFNFTAIAPGENNAKSWEWANRITSSTFTTPKGTSENVVLHQDISLATYNMTKSASNINANYFKAAELPSQGTQSYALRTGYIYLIDANYHLYCNGGTSQSRETSLGQTGYSVSLNLYNDSSYAVGMNTGCRVPGFTDRGVYGNNPQGIFIYDLRNYTAATWLIMNISIRAEYIFTGTQESDPMIMPSADLANYAIGGYFNGSVYKIC